MAKAGSKKRFWKVALVGCGGITGTWLNTVKKFYANKFGIVAFVDPFLDSAEARLKEFGVKKHQPKAYTTLKEALKDREVDVVFCCTPQAYHKPVALEAFKAGCHVLTEKPLADTLPNARIMRTAAAKAKRAGVTIQNYRYNPDVIAIRKLFTPAKLGKLVEVACDFYLGGHFGGYREELPHVLLDDMAIHHFDTTRYMLNEAPAEAVYCREYRPAHSWYQGNASAQAIFEMKGGVAFSYRGSWCAEGHSTGFGAHWRFVGEKGTVLWDADNGIRAEKIIPKKGAFIMPVKELKVPKAKPAPRLSGHGGVFADFLRQIETGTTAPTCFEQNFHSVAMVHSAIASAESGKRVKVPAK